MEQFHEGRAFKLKRPPPSLNMDLVAQPVNPFSLSITTPVSARGEYFPPQASLLPSPLDFCPTPLRGEQVHSARAMFTPINLPLISPISFFSHIPDTPNKAKSFELP